MGFTVQGAIIYGEFYAFEMWAWFWGISIKNFTTDYSQESEQPSCVEHFVSSMMFLPAFHSGR